MATIRFVGDVHGKYQAYKRIIRGCQNSIQVGDMGVGFRRLSGYRAGEFLQNPPHAVMRAGGHRFIRGNHDNPAVCKGHSQYIPDGHIEGDMMFIGGAQSIDKEYRVEGYSWWPDEELSIAELDALVGVYTERKPRVMVTHDCPDEIATAMAYQSGRNKLDFKSRTRQALQAMLSAHSPEIWVYGHWHISFDQVSLGTRFICLAELETKDIDVGLPANDNEPPEIGIAA